jgi:hypothetical protein
MTRVTTVNSVNVYTYHRRNLWISYSIAITLTTLANILGLYACMKDNMVYERTLAFILITAGRGDIAELFSDHLRGDPQGHTLIASERMEFDHVEELGVVLRRVSVG